MNSVPLPLDTFTPAEFDVVLRQDLASFAHRAFLQLNPGTPFLPNWHLELMAAKLRDCMLGRTRRLIINIPPRYMKSLTASVAFPAWLLGHRPSTKIVAISYAQDLSDKHALDCRAVIDSDWYRRIFETRISRERKAVADFKTNQEGFRMATSVGGTLTGRGGDFIIIDDPLKPDEAVSQAVRTRCNQWYDSVLSSRLNNKQSGCIVIIMQRLHEDDLVGHVLEKEAWEVLSLPAIAEKDEEFIVDTPWGEKVYRRSAGGILHPAFESAESIERMSKNLGEYNFAGQYQQSPAPLGGGLVKEEWFPRYTEASLPNEFDQIICSWDTANKPSELSDFSAGTVWGINDEHVYLLDVVRRRMDYPELKRAVAELAARWSATVVLIEDKASGTQLIQELHEAGVHGVQKYTPKSDKVMRLHAQCATIESKFVHLPSDAPWLAIYLHELTTFPASKHADQVDSTSQALEWIKIGQPGMGLFFFYKRWNKELRERGEI